MLSGCQPENSSKVHDCRRRLHRAIDFCDSSASATLTVRMSGSDWSAGGAKCLVFVWPLARQAESQSDNHRPGAPRGGGSAAPGGEKLA